MFPSSCCMLICSRSAVLPAEGGSVACVAALILYLAVFHGHHTRVLVALLFFLFLRMDAVKLDLGHRDGRR